MPEPASKSFKVTGESISSGSGIDHLVLFGDTSYLILSGPDGRLLADDQWCTGRDRQPTSLYAANLVACGPKQLKFLEEVVSDRNSSEGTESEVGVGADRSCNVGSGLYYDVDPELDSDNCPAQISAAGDGIC